MLQELALLLVRWRPHFASHATWLRACSLLLSLLVTTARRHTITSSLRTAGRDQLPHAADYFVFSRANWEERALFDSVADVAVETLGQLGLGGRLVVAIDDTGLKKTGKTIEAAGWQRDPLSPAFHLNLRWGLRFVHMAAIVPGHQLGFAPVAVSIGFRLAPALKRPKKSAPQEEHAAFKVAKRKQNLSTIAVDEMRHLRENLDHTGRKDLNVLMAGDASYLNKTILRGLPHNMDIIARVRGTVRLYAPAPAGGRKKYGEILPTPIETRQNKGMPWQVVNAYYAGARRDLRYKEVPRVMWKSAGANRVLRLIVMAPTPYRAPGGSGGRRQLYYREPAYLLTTDMTAATTELIQAYLDRWQIEVEHRDEKSVLGVGEAQVHADKSVVRMHSAHVAMWSMAKLAVLRTEGLARTDAYPRRARWYPGTDKDRPSAQDIIELLRMEVRFEARRARTLDRAAEMRHDIKLKSLGLSRQIACEM
jgi:hypothetical protein